MGGAMATFIAKGSDVIGSPSIGTTSGGGTGGSITLNAGVQIWPDDYVIEFTTTRETGIGELNRNSAFTAIRVFESYADFLAGTPIQTYSPQNPGQEASIQGDLSGLGDTYVRFNANVLVSSDPGAPQLDQLFVAPGSDAGSAIGSLMLARNTDLDLDGDGRITGPLERGNGLFFTGLSDFVYICFTPGARIATAAGEIPVERLQVGDRVVTRDNGLQAIRWIGQRSIQRPTEMPVRVRAGAFGGGVPERDLVLSANHRILMADAATRLALGTPEVLVAAKHLAGRPDIVRITPGRVTFIHLLFDRHEVILANGLWSESFHPGDRALNGLDGPQRAEVLALFPELAAMGGVARPLARPDVSRAEALAAWG
jgi:hypothetical protein